jgi:hypothetical protein
MLLLPKTLAAAALALAVAAPTSQAATDTLAATTAKPTPLAAGYGKVLYSAWNGSRYRLTALGGDALGVAGSFKPFTVDIGKRKDGHVVSVYNRSGRLFLYDFTTSRERALKGTTGAVAGSISGDRLVFATKDALYARSITGDAASKKLASKVVLSVDTRNSRTAFSGSREWSHEPWLATQTGLTRLTKVPGGGASPDFFDTLNPTFSGNSIYWLLARQGEHDVGEIHRYNRALNRDERVVMPIDGVVSGFAYDGGRAYYSVGTEIHQVVDLKFEKAPRIRMYGA